MNMTVEIKEVHRTKLIPKQHQLYTEDALNLTIVDLLNRPNGDGYFGFLSKADLILIFTVFGDLQKFLDAYKVDVQSMIDSYKYTVVTNPHYFLKKIVG